MVQQWSKFFIQKITTQPENEQIQKITLEQD